MLNFFSSSQLDELISLFNTANNLGIPPQARKVAIEKALSLIPKINKWPIFHSLKRNRAEASFLCLRSELLPQLPNSAFVEAREQGVRDLEKAFALLKDTPKDPFLGTIMANLGVFYGSREKGDKSENIERAIEWTSKAKALFRQINDPFSYAQACAGLAETFAQKPTGDFNENLKRSHQEIEEALSIVPKAKDPTLWAMLNATKGKLISMSKGGNRGQNLQESFDKYGEVIQTLDDPSMDPYNRFCLLATHAKQWMDRNDGSKTENLEKAVEYINHALNSDNSKGLIHRTDFAKGYLYRAQIYSLRILGDKLENLQFALDSTLKSKEFFQQAQDKSGIAMAQVRQAMVLQNLHQEIKPLKNPDEIESLLLNSQKILEENDCHDALAECLNCLGNYYYAGISGSESKSMELAMKAHSRIMDLKEKTDLHGYYVAAMNLANAYMDCRSLPYLERVEKAIQLMEAAHDYFDRNDYSSDLNLAKSNLASILNEQEIGAKPHQQERALALLEEAMSGEEYLKGDWEGIGRNVLVFANTCINRVHGNPATNRKKALELLTNVASTCGPERNLKIWTSAMLSLNELLLSSKTGGKDSGTLAKKGLSVLLDKVNKTSMPFQWARAQSLRARWLMKEPPLGKFDNLITALELLNEVLVTFKKYGSALEIASTKYEIGLIHSIWNESDSSHSLEGAIKLFKEVEGMSQNKFPTLNFLSHLQLGEIYSRMNSWKEADSVFTAALDVFGKEINFESNEYLTKSVKQIGGQMLSFIPLAALMCGDIKRALEISESLRAVNLRGVFKWEETSQDEKSHREIQKLTGILNLGEKTFDRSFAEKRIEVIRMMESATQRLDEFNKEKDSFSIESLLLRLEEWVFVPILAKNNGKALLIPPRGRLKDIIVSETLPFGKKTLTEDFLVKNSVSQPWGQAMVALEANAEDDANKLKHAIEFMAQKVMDYFGRWLVDTLNSKGVERGARLVIVPQGALGVLPLHLATRGKNFGNTLMDHYEISYAPSLAVLDGVRNRTKKQGMEPNLGLVSSTTKGLNFSQAESTYIEKVFKNQRTLIGSELKLEEVLEVLSSTNYWHFSTHGKFNAVDSLKSCLILSDREKLVLEELVRIRVGNPPRLVALSACETGVHDIHIMDDEFIGLPGAFLQIGTAGVIGTLWEVSDMESALIMMKFYENHILENMEPPTALRYAQLWLRDLTFNGFNEYLRKQVQLGYLSQSQAEQFVHELGDSSVDPTPFSSPFFWGAFVYYGL